MRWVNSNELISKDIKRVNNHFYIKYPITVLKIIFDALTNNQELKINHLYQLVENHKYIFKEKSKYSTQNQYYLMYHHQSLQRYELS